MGESRRTAGIETAIRVNSLAAAGEPRGARRAALAGGFVSDIEGVTDPAELSRIGRGYQSSFDAQERGFRNQDALANIALKGRASTLSLMLNRDPVGAAANDIFTSGLGEAEGFLQNQQRPQARQSLQNTAAGLDLQRQQYLDAFAGQQKDLRLNVIRPQDTQDPATVLGEIKNFKTQVLAKLDELGNAE